MNSIIFVGTICACLFSGLADGAPGDDLPWGYPLEGEGYVSPDEWATIVGSFCNGTRQSPIDVITEAAECDNKLSETKYNDYDSVPDSMSVENNGHTVHFKPKWTDNRPYISGGGLSTSYKAASYHMHWGADDTKGSEHTVDGQKYPAELHIIHTKGEKNVSEAVALADGVVVMTYFFEVVDNNNEAFQKVIDAMKNVSDSEATADIVPIRLDSILPGTWPDEDKKFYKYEGSLTTPGCNEAVTFYIFEDKIEVSSDQLGEIRTAVKFPGGVNMADNFRPVQNLLNRKIYKSCDDNSGEVDDDGSSMLTFNVFLVAFLGAVSYIFQ